MSHYVYVCVCVCADERLATPFIVVDGGLWWPCCCHIKQLLEQLSSYYYGRCVMSEMGQHGGEMKESFYELTAATATVHVHVRV